MRIIIHLSVFTEIPHENMLKHIFFYDFDKKQSKDLRDSVKKLLHI